MPPATGLSHPRGTVENMSEPTTPKQFHETDGVEDWRVVFEGACAHFRTGSFAAGVALVDAIGELADAANHHPDVDLRYESATVRLRAHDIDGLSERDVTLAGSSGSSRWTRRARLVDPGRRRRQRGRRGHLDGPRLDRGGRVLKAANLALRFILELGALVALGYWGFHTGSTEALRWILGIGAPLLMAVVWGLFIAPRARFHVPDAIWILLQVVVFGSAAAALFASDEPALGVVFLTVVILNALLMVLWRQGRASLAMEVPRREP